MDIETRDELISAVKDYSLRSDAPVDLFIKLFETDLKTLVTHYLSETVVDLTISSGKVTLPADFLKARDVKVDGCATRQLGIRDTLVYADEVGYRQVGKQYVFVGRADIKKAQIVYTAKVPALTETNPTNWLLTNFPNVYLHGVLAKLYRWAKDDVAEGLEKQSLGEALAVVAEDDRQGRNPAAPNSFGGGAAW
ncbi:phage adaptor protein [Agrobacterium tumefaciens]|uniref:phage adaptor protein n=1 Tax=Agrobacterium tumefaciens TaxID=358 RepID=UPI00101A44B0|nr:hypothetical protein [Agrobacterium tumefaciens]UXS04527.1 hypothetical protein FY156_24000 [Agrobacterium tumefaciens]